MCQYSQTIITLTLAVILTACGGSDGGGDAAAKNSIATAGAQLSDSGRFDRDYRKKGCELLTAELAAASFGVPAADLKQTKIMGCIYTWNNETEKLEASIAMIQAHKSEAGAASWFANATKSKTAEEMKAEMESIAEKVGENEALGTQAEKNMAKGFLVMAGSKAVNYEDVTAVGDEARASDDGSIYVRVDNLTFIVAAYKGAKAPQLDLKGADVKDMIKLAKKHDEEWAKVSAPQRKQDSIKLAKLIVAEL